ncbi:reducing hydrogenase subunit alpha [Xylanimonas allomyrinae]|uniref:Reducing hydrogenase subunit alpha n=1 Tax=Xylanimonas allomyrinae TaxID=2509459 RepID=A0A4P6EMN6_9MICO|nr:nickel-dependent hydrogenase large subunit [Xylanimonas allomyrinae]QAY64140.1 reducing hydrogenase subunit alpha [Xylanimonas allomyrinae]
MTRLVLDELLDPSEVRVVVDRAADGSVARARLALSDLPRVEPVLLGRPVARIPALVERLCGLCPAAHHLAGVRALEALGGAAPLPAQATAVRRLLHHASAVQAHAARAATLGRDPADVAALARFAADALAAAGMPSHFPATAVPGGVRVTVPAPVREALLAAVPDAVAAARRIALGALADAPDPAAAPLAFTGADVALVDADGRPDLLGTHLRAVAADGTVLHHAQPAARLTAVLAEQHPGAAAPRPYLRMLGPDAGRYRVGPVAQLGVGPLRTPQAADLQDSWARGPRAAAPARAIMAVAAVEAVAEVLSDGAVCAPPEPVAVTLTGLPAGASGVGWVDGPRGLLVHRYVTGDDDVLHAATILTPTAQNEPWLADLLHAAAQGDGTQGDGTKDSTQDGTVGPLERAVREADPCLPCTAAPLGAMRLTLTGAPDTPEGR